MVKSEDDRCDRGFSSKHGHRERQHRSNRHTSYLHNGDAVIRTRSRTHEWDPPPVSVKRESDDKLVETEFVNSNNFSTSSHVNGTSCSTSRHVKDEAHRQKRDVKVESGRQHRHVKEQQRHLHPVKDEHCVSETKSLNETECDEPNLPVVIEKEKPNFEVTGLLAAETNTQSGVVLKHSIPIDGRLPTKRWRLYVFKGEEQTKVFHVHRKQSFLIGKDPRIADILLLHPTISKQHAVIQYRSTKGDEVKPYIIDLESTNSTMLNGEKLEPRRYYELREKDTLRFGKSSREFILLHALSDTTQ